MNNNIKKVGVLALAMFTSLALCAFPGRFHGGFHHHHHHGTGFAIGAGILGAGLLAHAVYDATHPYYYGAAPVVVAPTPVVTQPVVVQQPVIQQPVIQQPVIQQPVVQQPVVQQPVVQQPVVQQQPVMQTQNVWVEGRYVDQVNAQGQTVRVWQPGHYEQAQVAVP